MRAVFVFTALLAACPAVAQDPDPELGRELAEQYCTNCHDIEADGQMKQYPPSFAAIAIFRSSEQITSRIQFPPFHVSMPQMSLVLDASNVEDLTAYIVGLER